jgi:hypothetical protein
MVVNACRSGSQPRVSGVLEVGVGFAHDLCRVIVQSGTTEWTSRCVFIFHYFRTPNPERREAGRESGSGRCRRHKLLQQSRLGSRAVCRGESVPSFDVEVAAANVRIRARNGSTVSLSAEGDGVNVPHGH